VTGLAVLGLLLVGSYLGGFLVGSTGKKARGLASGAGAVVLGFVSGPSALALLNQETLELFTPLVQVGVGWLAMNTGLIYGRVQGRSVRPLSALWGIAAGLLTLVGVTSAVSLALAWVPPFRALGLGERERWALGLGMGAALAETTRSVGRWARERCHARGPLFDRILDLSAADDLVPVVAAAVAFALVPLRTAMGALPVAAGAAAQLGVGFALGAIGALTLGRDFRLSVFRGTLLGVSLIGIGFAVQLRLSLVAVPFALGLGLVAVSRHRSRIRRAVSAERYVVVPILFLAGAMTPVGGVIPWLAALAVGARLVAKLIAGLGLWGAWSVARPAGPLLGAGLVSSGTLSLAFGVSFALHFPGPVGGAVLAAASLAMVVGELVGPPSLRGVLRRVGEVPAATAETEAVGAAEAVS